MKKKTLVALLLSTALVSTGIFHETSLIVSAEPTTDSEIEQLQELETVDEYFEPEHIDSGTPPEEAIILEDITTSLPASYDSRDKQVVTPVKNQGNYGTCWAFAATNAAESSLLSTGLADDANTCDLSESQLAYFTYHQRKDPLNMITTDYLLAKDNDYLNSGGRSFFATFNYACWSGVTKEDEITAYENLTEDTVLPDCYAFEKDAAHLKNAYWLSLDMKDEVKQSIMKYGAVTATYFHDSENLNYDTFAYHDPVFGFDGNHAVSIIGWDDNYSK